MEPLVSIVTPTWHRHDLLLSRCIPSVQTQDYPEVEHVLVSDGPDPELRAKINEFLYSGVIVHPVRFFEIPVREEGSYGCRPRRYGLKRASGDLIGYNDDDDSLRPDHVSKLVTALQENPEAGFARSLMLGHNPTGGDYVVGHGKPRAGNIGTPMVLHKRELLEVANWGGAGSFEDWDLFSQWIGAGVQYATVDEVTIDVWPSIYHNH